MLHKMACVKLSNCFLDVYSDGALVNCRFWMRSEVLDGRKKICKPIFTIFVFVLNLNFFVWIQIFIHIYRIQKQISWLPSINPKFSLPVSSNKVKNSWSVKEVLIFSTNRMTKLNKSSILWSNLCETQMEIVDIRRREVTKLWCESWHYVTRTSSDVNICNPQLFSLLTKDFYRT